MSKPLIEICANSVESVRIAAAGGAYRVELCGAMLEGGTTPSYGQIYLARKVDGIKLHVIIRPRGGDFLYTEEEMEIMLHDIDIAKQVGVDGIVIGCLTANGEIDEEKNRRLIERASGLSVTFHRAFDMCKNPEEALEVLIKLGVSRVLTSGQCANAVEGIPNLKKLIQQAAGRIIIMPGCGINENNISKLIDETGTNEFHMSLRKSVDSQMIYRNPNVAMGGQVSVNEYQIDVTSSEKLNSVISQINQKFK